MWMSKTTLHTTSNASKKHPKAASTISRGTIGTEYQRANITTQPTLPWARDDNNGTKKPRTGGRGAINPEDFKDLMKPLEKVAINKGNFKFQKPPTVVPFISLKNFQKKSENNNNNNIVVPQQEAEKSKLRQQQLNLLADKLGQQKAAAAAAGGVGGTGDGKQTATAVNQEQITEILKELEMVKLKYQEGLRRKLERDSMESRLVYDSGRGLSRSASQMRRDGYGKGNEKKGYEEERFNMEGYEEDMGIGEGVIRDPYWDMLFSASVFSDPYVLVPYLTDPNILYYKDEDLKKLLAKYHKLHSKEGKEEMLRELQRKQRQDEGLEMLSEENEEEEDEEGGDGTGGASNKQKKGEQGGRSILIAPSSSQSEGRGRGGGGSASAAAKSITDKVLQHSEGIVKELKISSTFTPYIQVKRPYEGSQSDHTSQLDAENKGGSSDIESLNRELSRFSLSPDLDDSSRQKLSEIVHTINAFDARQFVLHSGIQPALLNDAEEDLSQDMLIEETDKEKREVFDAQFLFKALVRDFDVYRARRVTPAFKEFCKRKQKERKLMRRKKFRLLRRDLKMLGYVSRDAYIATAIEIITQNFGEEFASIPQTFLPFFEEITTAIALNASYTWTKKVDTIVEFVLSTNAYMQRHPNFDNQRMLQREEEIYKKNLETWVEHHSHFEEFQIHYEKTGMYQEFEPAYADLRDMSTLEEEMAEEAEDTVEYEGDY